jgi:alpha-glucosidase
VIVVLLAIALGAIALGLAGAQWLRGRAQPALAGRLTVTDPALAQDLHTYSAGNFNLTLSAIGQDAPGGYQGPRMSITHKAAPGKWLWYTQRGQAFAAAAVGSAAVTETRGSYTFADRLTRTCANQTLDAIRQQGETLSLTGRLDCGGGKSVGYTLTLTPATDNQLSFDLSFDDPAINRAYLTYASDSDEHFFGFGEQYTYFDLKGQRVPIWVSEQGIGRGQQPLTFLVDLAAHSGGNPLTTYAAVPQYITSRMRSLFLENTQYAVFDLRTPDRVQVSAFAPDLRGRILYGATPEDLIREYTAWAGRMRPLPDWILSGAVVGLQGGTQTVRQIYGQLKQRGTPVSALWLQDWVGQRVTSFGKQLWWNWELDDQRYPGFSTLVSDLNQDGVRVLLYASPFLADASQKPGVRRNLFLEAAAQGYLVKKADGQPYLVQNTDFSAGMLDLTNPAAVAWYQSVLKTQMIALGASGWMAVFGEALPNDAVLANGATGADYHNRYPEAWAQLNRGLLDSLPNGDQDVFFTRSAFSRSPGATTLMWEGDQLTRWDAYDGIKSAVTGLLSGGLSGFSLNHSDIGGYTGINNPLVKVTRSKELLMRWMELSAFTTVYRTLQPRILNYVRALVGETDAEDVAAEAWAAIIRALPRFRGEADGFRGWTATIARNHATDHIRRRRPALLMPPEDLPHRHAADAPDTEALDRLATTAALGHLARLPADQAQAVLLRVVMGLDAATAGRVLNKTPNAVRNCAHRGLRSLSRLLGPAPGLAGAGAGAGADSDSGAGAGAGAGASQPALVNASSGNAG